MTGGGEYLLPALDLQRQPLQHRRQVGSILDDQVVQPDLPSTGPVLGRALVGHDGRLLGLVFMRVRQDPLNAAHIIY